MTPAERPADPLARDRLHALTDGHRTGAVPGGTDALHRAAPAVPWLPDPPRAGEGGSGSADAGATPVDDDVAAVVHRGRSEALAAAAAAYAAAHGHRPADPGDEPPAGGRRWWLSLRHAVVAGVAVAVLATGVVVRATAHLPAPPTQLPPVHVAASTGEAGGQPPPADGGGSPAGPASRAVTGAGAGPGADAPAGRVAGTGAGPGGASAVPGPPVAPGPVVHVVGQVAAPGVLVLDPGARVSDAVAAAGGPAAEADLSAVNLARPVVDGEQIHVPAHGEPVRAPAAAAGAGPGPTASGTGPGAPTGGSLVPLNTADIVALDALPGIGPVLAQRILDWRADHGPFRSVDELREVSGIGDAMMTRLRPLVTV